jgi:hypothetical protein
MQQTGGALGVAALSSVAASHGQSNALLTGAGFTVVALIIAFVAIRPVRFGQTTTARESAEEMIPLVLSE